MVTNFQAGLILGGITVLYGTVCLLSGLSGHDRFQKIFAIGMIAGGLLLMLVGRLFDLYPLLMRQIFLGAGV